MKRGNLLLHGHGRLTAGKARELVKLARRHFPPAVAYVRAHRAEIDALTRHAHKPTLPELRAMIDKLRPLSAVERARRRWNRKGD